PGVPQLEADESRRVPVRPALGGHRRPRRRRVTRAVPRRARRLRGPRRRRRGAPRPAAGPRAFRRAAVPRGARRARAAAGRPARGRRGRGRPVTYRTPLIMWTWQDEQVDDHRALDAALEDIAATGFAGALAMLRGCRYALSDPLVVDAARHA